MSIFRDTLEGYTLQDWLKQKIWPAEEKLTEQDVYDATMLSCCEAIKTGTTTVQDHYFKTDSIIKAGIDTGLRMQVTRVIMDVDNGLEQRKKELEKLFHYQNQYENITVNVGIHGLYTASQLAMEKAIQIAKQNHVTVHMHFCENKSEVEDIQKMHQATPAEMLENYFSETKNSLAHCVKVGQKEIAAIQKTDSSVIHCPISNLKLGCGIAPISQMLKQGINIALGTDGQGSGCNLDMFETMKYACLLQQGYQENPQIINAYEVLKMATINGAKAMGLEERIGSIEVGKTADMIMIDLKSETNQPVNDIISNIVYNGKGQNVCTTIIQGKIRMENRKLVGIDEKQIFEECQKIAQRILKD